MNKLKGRNAVIVDVFDLAAVTVKEQETNAKLKTFLEHDDTEQAYNSSK
jgi:hypothetical protein